MHLAWKLFQVFSKAFCLLLSLFCLCKEKAYSFNVHALYEHKHMTSMFSLCNRKAQNRYPKYVWRRMLKMEGPRFENMIGTLSISWCSLHYQCHLVALTKSHLWKPYTLVSFTANNFGLMCSRKRISQNSFPDLIHIIPKSFMVFCQELHNPKRNCENQIWT